MEVIMCNLAFNFKRFWVGLTRLTEQIPISLNWKIIFSLRPPIFLKTVQSVFFVLTSSISCNSILILFLGYLCRRYSHCCCQSTSWCSSIRRIFSFQFNPWQSPFQFIPQFILWQSPFQFITQFIPWKYPFQFILQQSPFQFIPQSS